MAGYRDTLNLPKTDFPMKADLTRREPERLAWWKERGVYAQLRQARAGQPVWMLHDGPPYSNNHLHMGTAANKIWKDAVVRTASQLGFDSPYVPGWDNHGMPIEIQVSKEFREKKLVPSRVELRRRCRSYAAEWVGIQREEFERLGVWGEWEHPYLTMDSAFEASILETFAALAARGYIQRGLRSIHWCPTDRTALAEAEIEYQDDPSPSIVVAFPLRSDPRDALAAWPDVAALAWTTTPWTLPANLGLMVDPGAEYVVVRADGRRFLLAAARLDATAQAAGWTDVVREGLLDGRALFDVVFEGPWGGDSRVVDGTPFVSMEDGTGLVHTAPGHGKEDFAVGQRSGLGVLCPVDEAGRLMEGAEPFVGRSVLEVNPDIVAWLKERGRLVASSTFTHSYPHCWRCRQPVIFRATKQWFLIIDHAPEPLAQGDARLAHRERALEAIERDVRWDPAGSLNRIRESVKARPDWCLSRQRAWGVGIPAVYCEACGEAFLDSGVMARAAEQTRLHGSDAWYERDLAEFVPAGFRCPLCQAAGPFRREDDILDVWFDSGSTHLAIRRTHPELAATWERAVRENGRIVYFEGPDQHRGWFMSSLMVGVGTADRAPFTDVLTHGWVLDATGRAMHKSLGNVILPADVVKQHGAELVRWWALATDWRSDVRVGDEILQRVADAYRKVRNTFRFLLGNLDGFTPADALPAAQLTAVDRAFAEHLTERVADLRRDAEQMLFHRVLDGLLDVCTVDLSAVFLDVAKDRLYTLLPDAPERRSAQTVLWQALHDLVVAAAPALVFTSEEVWQSHPGLLAECPSVHLAQWPERGAGAGAGAAWGLLRELRDAVNAALEPLRAAKQFASTAEAEVAVTVAPPIAERLAPYATELGGFLIVAEVAVRAGREGQAFEVEVAKTTFPKCERCWMHRRDVAAEGPTAGLCGRCAGVLAARGGPARV
ncbi:MAG TPA: isoleucine--tRNA ligase [Candidatus Saccharimonadaceae bacterium]|nr:isoleucine--tRNA ligase [Candidatus Saccharimonadaceae bacterium]